MLPIVYKLIAKLLAVRFSSDNKFLFNPQQIGFISGRFILKNVSMAWMAHDWVITHRIPTLFLNLILRRCSIESNTPIFGQF